MQILNVVGNGSKQAIEMGKILAGYYYSQSGTSVAYFLLRLNYPCLSNMISPPDFVTNFVLLSVIASVLHLLIGVFEFYFVVKV